MDIQVIIIYCLTDDMLDGLRHSEPPSARAVVILASDKLVRSMRLVWKLEYPRHDYELAELSTEK